MLRTFAILILVSFSFTLNAQDTILFTPGHKLKDGFVRRIFLGKNYRDVWKTGVKAPTLDMAALGLKAIESGGRLESKSLKMEDQAGRTWTGRSVEKDLSKMLNDRRRASFMGDLLRDHASSNEPFAALVVQSLAKEIGIYHCTPRLVVLKNEEALGEFRKEYAGMPVLLEERPSKTWVSEEVFGKPEKIIDTEELIKERFEKNDFRFDEKMYLKGRLLDMLIGDWSRHDEQYKWAVCRENGEKIVRPIPRDRDHALYKNEGLLKKLSLTVFPYPTDLGDRITKLEQLNHMAGNMDLLILTGISKENWIRFTAEVMHEITEADIDKAVSFLPDETEKIDGAELRKLLKSRLKDLPLASMKYYAMINKNPFIPATEKDDEILITRTKDSVTVMITTIHKSREKKKEGSDHDQNGIVDSVEKAGDRDKESKSEKQPVTWFYKTFSASETQSITIATLDEEDKFFIEGEYNKHIRIKLMPGPAEDEIRASNSAEVKDVEVYELRPRQIFDYLTSGTRTESRKKKNLIKH